MEEKQQIHQKTVTFHRDLPATQQLYWTYISLAANVSGTFYLPYQGAAKYFCGPYSWTASKGPSGSVDG